MSDIFTFHFPDIGEGVVEGEIIEWLKKEGDAVKQDEPVVVVMTDKATVELPAPHPGIIAKHYFAVGQMAIKDKPLYDIQLKEKLPEIARQEKPAAVPAIKPVQPKPAAEVAVSSQGKALATPKVRGVAKELGVDIGTISGSGKEGRVMLEDLQGSRKEIQSIPALLEDDVVKPLAGVRGVMARKMDHRHIPQFSYFETVEVTRLMQLRHHLKGQAEQEDIHLSYMPFFIRALSLTMKEYPIMNSTVDMAGNNIIFHVHHNVGIAIASQQGLMVPVLKGVEAMKIDELIHAYDHLKKEVAGGKAPPELMKGATVTISNFGVLGGDGTWATPLVNAPEVAILAVARMRKEPVVRNQEVVVRDVLPLSWSFDHRIIDGELAATISHYYCTLLRDPAALL